MADNSAAEEISSPEAPKNDSTDKEAGAKGLPMSFADWKKCKEAKEQPEDVPAARNGRKPHKSDNKQQSGSRNHNNNNNSFPPLSRPPPLPFPLINLGFGTGPGSCGPSSMMPPSCNMGNMRNMGPGPGPRNHRPLQPPPFWEDMMSPQHRPPPIQPPMPKCPSLWNLVPKEKQSNPRQQKQNTNQNNQPNKKYKVSNNNNNNNNNNCGENNALLDAALMPPPPPPGDMTTSTVNSNSASSANKVVKKKKGGTFVQIDGKWIQRPEAPPPLEEAPPGTKEDRQRQWKEYRQAMKPFKNREFHNWKRTVQRLSKLPRDQLDEKQLERLQKAEEFIDAHKAMLTIKHAEQWVQQSNQKSDTAGNGQGQVYVRKPVNPAWNKSNEHNTFQRGVTPIRKQTFGTGRAIKGGMGTDFTSMPPLPSVAPPPPTIGPFTDLTRPPLSATYFGQSLGYNANLYGPDTVTSTNTSAGPSSTAFYSNYTSSFIKGGTLLPP